MQIIQKKEIWKYIICNEYFSEAYPMWILNICVFASTSENEALILYFKKNNFEHLKKLQSIVNIFVFFIKIACWSKESPLSNPPPL